MSKIKPHLLLRKFSDVTKDKKYALTIALGHLRISKLNNTPVR